MQEQPGHEAIRVHYYYWAHFLIIWSFLASGCLPEISRDKENKNHQKNLHNLGIWSFVQKSNRHESCWLEHQRKTVNSEHQPPKNKYNPTYCSAFWKAIVQETIVVIALTPPYSITRGRNIQVSTSNNFYEDHKFFKYVTTKNLKMSKAES